MSEQPTPNWYVSKRVHAPARTVAASFDRVVAGLAIVAADGSELRISPRELPVGVPRAGPDRRRVDARLRLPGWMPTRIAVEVAVEPWSRTECEIAVRPARKRILPDPVRYGRAAAMVLEELRAALADAAIPRAEVETSEPLRRAS